MARERADAKRKPLAEEGTVFAASESSMKPKQRSEASGPACGITHNLLASFSGLLTAVFVIPAEVSKIRFEAFPATGGTSPAPVFLFRPRVEFFPFRMGVSPSSGVAPPGRSGRTSHSGGSFPGLGPGYGSSISVGAFPVPGRSPPSSERGAAGIRLHRLQLPAIVNALCF